MKRKQNFMALDFKPDIVYCQPLTRDNYVRQSCKLCFSQFLSASWRPNNPYDVVGRPGGRRVNGVDFNLSLSLRNRTEGRGRLISHLSSHRNFLCLFIPSRDQEVASGPHTWGRAISFIQSMNKSTKQHLQRHTQR